METNDFKNSEAAEQEQDKVKTNQVENTSDQPEKESNVDEQAPVSEEKEDVSSESISESEENAKEEGEQKEKTEKSLIDEDYSSFSKELLVKELTRLVNEVELERIKLAVENIKTIFYKKHNTELDALKKKFIESGGVEEEFEAPKDELEEQVNLLLKIYKEKKVEKVRSQEKEKELNLELKFQVIEEIKELINKEESIGETFKEFRGLQDRWKEIGPVPQQRVKDLWSTYHHHVEKFYDYIKINKELRDLDLKKNQELKEGLCDKADKLLEESSIVNAFKVLQKYHNQWREIGPVPLEVKDSLWEKFSNTTKQINKKHQEYFKNLKEKQKDNLAEKTKLCEQAEELLNCELTSHKDWNQKTQKIFELQNTWRTIGFAPKSDNNKIYARFREACDAFFEKKREFYAQNKELQDQNLELKLKLCERAEEIKDSTDWKKTTKEMLNLQKQWKDIGPVPRRHSDKIWKRFRAACDIFFNNKSSHYGDIEEDYKNNLALKEELIQKVESYEFDSDTEKNYNTLKGFQDEWANIGFVPYNKKDEVQNKFRDAINAQFDKLKIDDKEKKILKFQTRLENLHHKPKASSKIKHEREKFFNKIKKLETNIKLWENNLGFFNTESNEAGSMIQDYKDKITQAKEELKVLEEKIRMIDRMENE